MIPLDDWLEIELWEGQRSLVDIAIELPESVHRETVDEAAVFKVLRKAEGVTRVNVGDVVQFYGLGAPQRIKKPNGKFTIVAKAEYVCFIMEEEDLRKEDSSGGTGLITS